MPHVLIVDDDLSYLFSIADLLGREGFSTSTAANLTEAREEIARQAPDVVVLDSSLPDGTGMELMEELRALPGTEVVFVTGNASIDAAVEAIHRGAANYLTKPLEFERLKAVLAGVMQTRALKAEIGTLRGELRKLGRFGPLIGSSPAMQRVYDLIARGAPTEATILITGETGTGKELVSRAIHDQSQRRDGPFVALNCGAIQPNLIESELFGHEKGSFTGAERLHRGHFEMARGGTLLLDEITEMPVELQVKLLRVLEGRVFRRVGGQEVMQADARVIAASNRPPRDAVADKKLREDLFYRLNVFPIQLPALRERSEDVELLAQGFLEALNKSEGCSKRFSRTAVQRMTAYSWPGNVRELKNMVHQSFIMSEEMLNLESLPGGAPEADADGLSIPAGTSLAEAERRIILATLEHLGGNKTRAAELLGISLKTLYTRLTEYRAMTD